MGLGRAAWREARDTLQKILAAEDNNISPLTFINFWENCGIYLKLKK
jgi:hypothetical protein